MLGYLIPAKCVQHKTGQLRNHKSGSSGGAKVSEQGEAITFADVAGVDEAKEELEEIVVCQTFHRFIYYILVMNYSLKLLNPFCNSFRNTMCWHFAVQEFLRNPDKYVRLGARPPRGVLLVSVARLFVKAIL